MLAFIKRVRNIRYGEGCTIMPIPTTSRSMIAIAGSAANVSNLIKFMCAIGLISVECSKYQFNSRYEKCNFSKKYRYYYDNEVKIIDYCEREPIKEFVPKNHPDRKLNDLPMPLISFKSVSFSARLNLVKPSDISAAEFEKCISELLFRKYPDLEKYQMLADEINETYYAQYPELSVIVICATESRHEEKSASDDVLPQEKGDWYIHYLSQPQEEQDENDEGELHKEM